MCWLILLIFGGSAVAGPLLVSAGGTFGLVATSSFTAADEPWTLSFVVDSDPSSDPGFVGGPRQVFDATFLALQLTLWEGTSVSLTAGRLCSEDDRRERDLHLSMLLRLELYKPAVFLGDVALFRDCRRYPHDTARGVSDASLFRSHKWCLPALDRAEHNRDDNPTPRTEHLRLLRHGHRNFSGEALRPNTAQALPLVDERDNHAPDQAESPGLSERD